MHDGLRTNKVLNPLFQTTLVIAIRRTSSVRTMELHVFYCRSKLFFVLHCMLVLVVSSSPKDIQREVAAKFAYYNCYDMQSHSETTMDGCVFHKKSSVSLSPTVRQRMYELTSACRPIVYVHCVCEEGRVS